MRSVMGSSLLLGKLHIAHLPPRFFGTGGQDVLEPFLLSAGLIRFPNIVINFHFLAF
jgi:hypothetical protein